jgi:hypothetical protein
MTIPAPNPETPQIPPSAPGKRPPVPEEPGPDRTIPKIPLTEPEPPQRTPSIVGIDETPTAPS